MSSPETRSVKRPSKHAVCPVLIVNVGVKLAFYFAQIQFVSNRLQGNISADSPTQSYPPIYTFSSFYDLQDLLQHNFTHY
jgi:hypothetical protein